MTRGLVDSQAKKVVLFLAAALIWMLSGALIAPAPSPGLAGVPKAPGQGNPRTARMQAQRPQMVLTRISPTSAPPGGIGEFVLTGKNFVSGMYLDFTCLAKVPNLKVETPERAVGQIRVALDAHEGECPLRLVHSPPPPQDETQESRGATLEVAQIAPSVRFTINKSAPMAILLGEYTLLPEEEINLMNTQAASAQQIKQQAAAAQPSKDQQQQMKKQQDELKEMRDKYKRGEISQAEYMAAAMKAASSMMGQMTPQQKAMMGQQAAMGVQGLQTSQKLMELQKQEKNGELRLNKGSLSFLADGNAAFAEPVSAVKEIVVVPPPAGEKASHAFQVAFSSGKKYSFRISSNKVVDEEVNKLKKQLGK